MTTGSGHVLDGAFHLRPLAAQDQQREGGHQQHFNPDVQVEDIAGEEGAADSRPAAGAPAGSSRTTRDRY
jgi:hypothetical protein